MTSSAPGQGLRAAAALRQVGADVATMLCVLDRGLNRAARLATQQIALQSVLLAPALEVGAPPGPDTALGQVT